MKQPKPSIAYLFEMLESAHAVRDYVAGLSFDDFWDRPQTRDAVAMRLTVIGESATKVDAATVAALPAILFPKISATRNRIVHDYGKVDFTIVWKNHAGGNPVAHRRARRTFQKESTTPVANC